MPSFLPDTLTVSNTNGFNRPYLVTSSAISSTSPAVHTATQLTNNVDEIWIWAQNNHTANVELVIGWGGVLDRDCIKVTIPYKAGLHLVVPGLRLNSGLVVRAAASVPNVINLFMNVNAFRV